MLNQVRYLPVQPKNEQALKKQIYKQINKDFGLVVDPFRLHALLPKLLAGVWAACRETELVGIAPRNVKELVAACVSETNNCPYCVDAHTMLLNSVGEQSLSKNISQGNIDNIIDKDLRDIADWALSSRSPHSEKLVNPLFPEDWRAELIGMAVFYHYLNRMVHVFLPEQLLPVKNKATKQILKQIAGWVFSFTVNRKKSEGTALVFLEPTTLPIDMQWAAPRQNLAQGFSQMATIIEQLVDQHIPDIVHSTYSEFLEQWQGEDAPLDITWLAEHHENIDEKYHSMIDLALIITTSPYRVTEQQIERFIQDHTQPETLLVTAAWASFSAARKTGAWLYKPFFQIPSDNNVIRRFA